MNELQLTTAAYKTTAIGVGEALRRLDEAKQWAIGDWLVDGKSHYGDGLYAEAARVLGLEEQTLRLQHSMAAKFELLIRINNLSWNHHREVSSLKTLSEDKKCKLYRSDEHDMKKAQEFLKEAEKKEWSVRELRDRVASYVRDQDAKIKLANEPEKYDVIYADPPWEYEKDQEYFGQNVERHYQTMSEEELIGLPISKITASDCVLYMWTTAPKLNVGIRVLEGWGFQYKTCLVWDKVKHNMGFYNSIRHEILLIGGRGSSAPSDQSAANQTDSVYVEERTEHSKKPDFYYSMIERLHPEKKKRIELFAREQHKGWEVWGNEV
jgi:N6-adenosine-specific RNA methylase IME4